jgi:hypothetical protein
VADDPYPALTEEAPSKGRAEEMAVADAKQAVRWLPENWRDSEQTEWPLTGEYVDTWVNRRLRTMTDWPEPLKMIYEDTFKAHMERENVPFALRASLSKPGPNLVILKPPRADPDAG